MNISSILSGQAAVVIGALLLTFATEAASYTVISKFNQAAGPNVEEARIGQIRCNWAGENGSDFYVYEYPGRNKAARAVRMGSGEILGNYADARTAARAACASQLPVNLSGPWKVSMAFSDSKWCHFRGTLNVSGQSYEFTGNAYECFGDYIHPPATARCEVKIADKQGVIDCKATFPASPQRPALNWRTRNEVYFHTYDASNRRFFLQRTRSASNVGWWDGRQTNPILGTYAASPPDAVF